MIEKGGGGAPPPPPPKPKPTDTRNFWERGLGRMFFDPRPEPYVISWTPIADGIAEHQQQEHDYEQYQRTRNAWFDTKSRKSSESSKQSFESLEAHYSVV